MIVPGSLKAGVEVRNSFSLISKKQVPLPPTGFGNSKQAGEAMCPTLAEGWMFTRDLNHRCSRWEDPRLGENCRAKTKKRNATVPSWKGLKMVT